MIHFKTIPKENCFHSTIFGKQATKKQKILFLKKKKIVLIKLKINRIYNKNNQLNFTHELNGF